MGQQSNNRSPGFFPTGVLGFVKVLRSLDESGTFSSSFGVSKRPKIGGTRDRPAAGRSLVVAVAVGSPRSQGTIHRAVEV